MISWVEAKRYRHEFLYTNYQNQFQRTVWEWESGLRIWEYSQQSCRLQTYCVDAPKLAVDSAISTVKSQTEGEVKVSW